MTKLLNALVAFCLLLPLATYAQTGQPQTAKGGKMLVKGFVLDENAKPLPGAVVMIDGTEILGWSDCHFEYVSSSLPIYIVLDKYRYILPPNQFLPPNLVVKNRSGMTEYEPAHSGNFDISNNTATHVS